MVMIINNHVDTIIEMKRSMSFYANGGYSN